MAYLEFESVDFSYGNKPVLRDFSFSATQGELISVLGQSGCGKTSLLRLCAGFEKADSGSIHIQASESPQSRVGFVFKILHSLSI